MMLVMDLSDMTWDYCMQKAFEAMHSHGSAETQLTKVSGWVTIAREIRESESAIEAAVQKIIAEAKPV